MEKNKNKDRHLLERLHNFLKKHWVWYTIIISIPSIWFSVVLQYFGKILCFINAENNITVFGIVCTLVLLVFVLGITFLNNLYLSRTETGNLERMDGKIKYLSTILDNVDKICDEKYSRLKNKILEAKTTPKDKAKIISDPNNQLKRIITGITECLVKLLNNRDTEYTFKDFFITIAYNFPQEKSKWRWTEGTVEKEMDLDKLLEKGCQSTFNYLLSSNKPYYFSNNKEMARKEGRYLYNPQDELSEEIDEPVGSIFCHRYQVKKSGKVYVDAMISISTQKKRFSKEEEAACNNVRENMVSLVRDTFGKRIGIELSLLYLEYLQMKEEEEKKIYHTEIVRVSRPTTLIKIESNN